jgi:hypothetical protein
MKVNKEQEKLQDIRIISEALRFYIEQLDMQINRILIGQNNQHKLSSSFVSDLEQKIKEVKLVQTRVRHL